MAETAEVLELRQAHVAAREQVQQLTKQIEAFSAEYQEKDKIVNGDPAVRAALRAIGRDVNIHDLVNLNARYNEVIEQRKQAESEAERLADELAAAELAAIDADAVERELGKMAAMDDAKVKRLFEAIQQLRAVVQDWNLHIDAKIAKRALVVRRTEGKRQPTIGAEGKVTPHWWTWVSNPHATEGEMRRQVGLLVHNQGQWNMPPKGLDR